jgi:hypothetical protein
MRKVKTSTANTPEQLAKILGLPLAVVKEWRVENRKAGEASAAVQRDRPTLVRSSERGSKGRQ